MQPPGLVWDTCSLMNLAATGRVESIVSALGCACFVVREVREREALYLRPAPDADKEEFDFSPFLTAGVFQEVELTAGERATFVQFAREVDDGEAMTAAVAVHRGLWVATDDKGALRLLAAQSPPVPTLRTLDWLKQWADGMGVSAQELGGAMRGIRWKARFGPKRATQDPALYDWWEANFPD